MPIDPNNLASTAKVTFADEFNGLSIWNGSSGTWSTAWWYRDEWGLYSTSNGSTLASNGELQMYINDNYAPTASVNPWTISNGVLNITASKTDPAIAGYIDNYAYTSGMINTWHSFSQQYGYFEISAKLPAGQGLWPSFWLLPQDGSWPPEIDVFEVLGHDTDTLYQTVHTEAKTGWHTAEEARTTTPDLSAGFHRFGVDWQKDYITFYFDGAKTGQFATPGDLHKPMYMIANLAVGGHWPGSPDASTIFPATLQIDYIRAYSALPTTTVDTKPGGGHGGGGGNGGGGNGGGKSLKGGSSHDNLVGEAGNDVIGGGDGHDSLQGGDGADEIWGEVGDDRLHGNMGLDTVHGGGGDDWVVGGKDADHLYGDDGSDIVHGNLGDDILSGGAGADVVRGGQGHDSLSGGDGNDWLAGDRGSDTIAGGAGADIFHSFDGAGLDRILDFSRAEGDSINLLAGSSYSVAQVGADTVVQVGAETQIVLVGVSAASLTGDWLAFS